jgi:hypothetical protein
VFWLPEVKDAAMVGGHIWEDNVSTNKSYILSRRRRDSWTDNTSWPKLTS